MGNSHEHSHDIKNISGLKLGFVTLLNLIISIVEI